MSPAKDLPSDFVAADARPPLVNRAFAKLLVASFGAMISFYLLFSVVPLYATAAGAGTNGAGMITGALMLATVALEPALPRLVARWGYRRLFAAGLVLLGVPSLLLIGNDGMATIVAVCVLRGFGLAIVVVLGGALVASVVAHERRGEALGVYGVIIGVPAIVALPLGVWLIDAVGYAPVFVAGALASLAGLCAVRDLPGKAQHVAAIGILAGLRMPEMVRPSLVMLAAAMGAGVVTTFLPLAFAEASGESIALALLAQTAMSSMARWWAGRYGDRYGQARLLMPGVIASAAGLLILVFADGILGMLLGMLCCGAGFGMAQNATLSLMFERVPASGYDMASALQSLAYDAGLGLGAALFGVFAARTGYPPAFAITAALTLAAVVPAWRSVDRNAKRGCEPSRHASATMIEDADGAQGLPASPR